MNSSLPTFKQAFLFWLKLGFISFGGPAGQIAIMHDQLVEKKKWISESRFMHALNYCMLLPGPEAQQLATYTGWLLHGIKGGLAAGILFILPSVFMLLGLSVVYAEYGNQTWAAAIFAGMKPAVVAIVILALLKISKRSLHSYFHYGVAAVSFIGIYFFNIPFPVLIFAAAPLAIVIYTLKPGLLHPEQSDTKKSLQEEGYSINSFSVLPHTKFNLSRLIFQLMMFLLLWILPYSAFYFFTSDFVFWKTLIHFFTQAAFVTFGGAYSVLPYVAQVSVEKFHWLTSHQMIDGLALGETTPGPLIMVLAFVGFMAGYGHSGGSLLAGSTGLLITAWYTFLPCFLFIFSGAPLIEYTQANKKIKVILSVITATVVGVVLNLTLYFAEAVILPEKIIDNISYFGLLWTVISFIAMKKFNIGMIPWIGISGLVGLTITLL